VACVENVPMAWNATHCSLRFAATSMFHRKEWTDWIAWNYQLLTKVFQK
jgi:hypothetical protein